MRHARKTRCATPDPRPRPCARRHGLPDGGRCPALGRPCIVGQEVCPVCPRAVLFERVVEILADGREVTLERPRIDPVACIGRGICEHECPVSGLAAIRVDAAGEGRDSDRTLVVEG